MKGNRQPMRYEKLDGLHAYVCIGDLMMHVRVNTDYEVGGFVFDRLIPSFIDFVFRFMIISGISVCCGYFDKNVNHQIALEQFYIKRFQKSWPFCARERLDWLTSASLRQCPMCLPL